MLELINISKKYNDSNYVLEGINFKSINNNIIELKGANGIGKSTLLNIIGGMTNFEGDVTLNGTSLKNNYKKYMKSVSLINNTFFLYEYLTPYEMIDMVLFFLDKQSLSQSLKKFSEEIRLDEYRDVLIRELSLGTKQKLALILTLIPEPNLLLLDEPFVNLDIKSRKVVLNYLKKYIEENNAILIYTTHSTDEYLSDFPNEKIILVKDERLNKVVLKSGENENKNKNI